MGATRNKAIIPRCHLKKVSSYAMSHEPPSGQVLSRLQAWLFWHNIYRLLDVYPVNLLSSPQQCIDLMHLPWCQGGKLHGGRIFLHLGNSAETWDGQRLFTARP
jgi:hypothetical protein